LRISSPNNTRLNSKALACRGEIYHAVSSPTWDAGLHDAGRLRLSFPCKL